MVTEAEGRQSKKAKGGPLVTVLDRPASRRPPTCHSFPGFKLEKSEAAVTDGP